MRRRELHRILASRGWLAEVDPALAAAVSDAGRLIEARRGEALYHPGDEPGGMYGVAEGGIVLSTFGRDGLPVPGHIMRRCTWFGYGSVLDRQRRALIPTANEPSLVLHVPLGELERLRDAFPSAGRAFGKLAMLGEALYLAIVTDLLISSTDRRIAAVLLRVTGAEAPGRRKDSPIDPAADPWAGPKGVPLTQGILAELANASRHTVARFVDRAVQAGWIDWRYGRVRILDIGRLSAFVAGQS
jgi:CRP/FNR family transcriptional regulator, cyclic AMP receptor protein